MFEKWSPPKHWLKISSLDMHTAGEPLRIYTGGLPEIKGKTILEKRRYFKENLDFIRTGTMWEPRGHADMYGVVVTEPETDDGDLGVFFLHNEGYSTMCGHAIIAITKVMFETGWIKRNSEKPVLKIDSPAGRIEATAHIENDIVKKVSFLNVPSFLYKKDLFVDVPGIGQVKYDIGFGGAYYVYCQAPELGLELEEKDHDQLVDAGRRIKNAVMASEPIHHPFKEDLSFLYGTIFIGPPKNQVNHSRNVCVFAEGQVDRSPTGTGVSARAAIHFARQELKTGDTISIESILGSCMQVKIVKETTFGPHNAIIPQVTGTASIVGQNEFYFDPDDPLKNGFIFR